jgi:hypothetical protein
MRARFLRRIALRDFGLLVGALALWRLSLEYEK